MIWAYGTGTVLGAMQFWGAWSGLTEMTGFFQMTNELYQSCENPEKIKESLQAPRTAPSWHIITIGVES